MNEKKKRNKKQDINTLAFNIVKEVTETEKDTKKKKSSKNPHAVALGRLGGKKGGKSRAKKLTPERRSEIARLAARARWKKAEEKK